MRIHRTMLLLGSVLVLLIPLAIGGAAAPTDPTPAPTAATADERLVEVNFREADFATGLRILFGDTPYSFVLSPSAAKFPKLSLELHGISFAQAISTICKATGVNIVREGDVFYFTPPQSTVTVNGQQVPIVGAMQVGPDGRITVGGESPANVSPPTAFPTPDYYQLPVPPGLADPLVRLEVDNAPLPEAIAKLTANCPVDVQVYPEIRKNVRVTAHVYMMPLTQFLFNLGHQASVAVGFDALDAEGKVIAPRLWWRPAMNEPGGEIKAPVKARYYLMPFSTLQLTDQARGLLRSENPFTIKGPGGVDLTLADVTYAEAIAKLAAASGMDLVVDPSVSKTLRVTAKIYRQPPDLLLEQLVFGAGLEVRQARVDAAGNICAPEGPRSLPPADSHVRYYIVPKSELKVSGQSAPPVSPKALAQKPGPTAPTHRAKAPAAGREVAKSLPLYQRLPGVLRVPAPSAPAQLDTHGGIVGLLKNSPTTIGMLAK